MTGKKNLELGNDAERAEGWWQIMRCNNTAVTTKMSDKKEKKGCERGRSLGSLEHEDLRACPRKRIRDR